MRCAHLPGYKNWDGVKGGIIHSETNRYIYICL